MCSRVRQCVAAITYQLPSGTRCLDCSCCADAVILFNFTMAELIGVHVLAQGHLNRTDANQLMETLWLVQRSTVLSYSYETSTVTNSAALNFENPT